MNILFGSFLQHNVKLLVDVTTLITGLHQEGPTLKQILGGSAPTFAERTTCASIGPGWEEIMDVWSVGETVFYTLENMENVRWSPLLLLGTNIVIEVMTKLKTQNVNSGITALIT